MIDDEENVLLGLMRPEMGDNRTTCTVIDGLKLICHTHLSFSKLDNFQFGQFVHRGEKHFLSRVLDVRVAKQTQMSSLFLFFFLGGEGNHYMYRSDWPLFILCKNALN